MTLKQTHLTCFNSGYCCLNSTPHTRINALAWYAVVSTETLNDLSSLAQPGSLLPQLGQPLLLFNQLIESGVLL
jgi:hypothetical protein